MRVEMPREYTSRFGIPGRGKPANAGEVHSTSHPRDGAQWRYGTQ